MNAIELIGRWNEQKGKFIQTVALLTDNDPMYEKGKKKEMFAVIKIKTERAKHNCMKGTVLY